MSTIFSGPPDNSDTRRTFIDGSSRSYALLRTAAVGLGVYQPGWRWSEHVGAFTGMTSENHIGYVVTGTFMVMDVEGETREVGPGEAFEIRAGSDAWVLGDEPCTAIDFIPIAGDGASGG